MRILLYNYSLVLLPGQASVLHVVFSLLDPAQSSPPYAAAGLSHCLVLVFSPELQVLLQCPYSLHSPQVPFTKVLIKQDKQFKRK